MTVSVEAPVRTRLSPVEQAPADQDNSGTLYPAERGQRLPKRGRSQVILNGPGPLKWREEHKRRWQQELTH